MKNPDRDLQSPARLAALGACQLLDTPAEENFDRFTRLASTVLDCPVSLVSLVTDKRQFFKSSIGLTEPLQSERETPLSYSFCQHVVKAGSTLQVEDARTDDLLQTNRAVSELGVISYLGVPLIDAEGYVLGSLCAVDVKPRQWSEAARATLTDLAALVMTEIELRKKAAALQAACEELRKTEAERDELVHLLVHDLRNPMTSMIMALEMVTTLHPTLAGNRGMQIARQSGHKLLAMISDILDVSKAEAGKLTLHLEQVPPPEVIEEAISQVTHTAAAAKVQLIRNWAVDLPEITADREMLRRLLVNLLANAIQHTPAGGTVQIRLLRLDAESIALFVEDNGEGIPAGIQDRIFEKFMGLEGRVGGWLSSGLGLTLCRKVAEAHGGHISVESVEGSGTRFQVILPIGKNGGGPGPAAKCAPVDDSACFPG